MDAYRPSTDVLRLSKETLDGYSSSEPPSPLIPADSNRNHLWGSKYQDLSQNWHRTQRSLTRGHRGRPKPLTKPRTSVVHQRPYNASCDSLDSDGVAINIQSREFGNGYHFPPKYPLKERIPRGIVSLWNFYNTGFGFFAVIYAMNIVAWGGIWFLLLVNAAPAMCNPDCDARDAPRQRWMETASQVLNALMCVMGFGLAPWRLRDLFYLLKFRLCKDHQALRRFAAVHRDWFRLPGSEELPSSLGPKNVEEVEGLIDVEAVPFPLGGISDPPLTGTRAPATRMYRVDLICWFNIANTGFQCCLASFLWAMNQFERPDWATAVFVVFACSANATGNILKNKEIRLVKSVEGVPVSKDDLKRLARDRELGIPHYNNLEDKAPTAKKKTPKRANTWDWGRTWRKSQEERREKSEMDV